MLKNDTLLNKLFICFFFICSTTALSQININTFYPNEGDLTFAASYTSKKSDTFYKGADVIVSNPASFGEISSTIYSLYAKYGINDSYSIVATLPYITSENENGKLDPVKKVSKIDGIQDFSLFFKAKITELENRNGSKFTVGASAGIEMPVGGYDEGGILALGNGATTFNGFALLQYVFPSNIFSEAIAGYSAKQNSRFNVPNALLYKLKLGYLNDHIYFHFSYTFQNSTSGIDIGSKEFGEAGGAFALAETRVNCENLEIGLYVPLYEKKLGVSAGFSEIVNGRNKANNTSFSIGLVYNFSTAKRDSVFIVPL